MMFNPFLDFDQDFDPLDSKCIWVRIKSSNIQEIENFSNWIKQNVDTSEQDDIKINKVRSDNFGDYTMDIYVFDPQIALAIRLICEK